MTGAGGTGTGIFIHRSQRTESLADALADVLAVPLADPFERDVVVVAGRGMERWLAMQLSMRHGVFANVAQPFPRAFVEDVLKKTLGARAERIAELAPGKLAWSVLRELPGFVEDPRFASIVRYVGGPEALTSAPLGTRIVSLAHRIADVLDRYATYRPRLVRAWLAGEDGEHAADFQPPLLRALRARTGIETLSELVTAAIHALAHDEPPKGLPPRVAVFGVSSLPPLYVSLLHALSRHCAVHFFVLVPSQEYFGDVLGKRERARLAKGREDTSALHLADGHPLLAALGRLGRDFQHVLEQEVASWTAEDDRFEPASRTDLLHTLQADLLELAPSGRDDAPLGVIAAGDRSITLHACHGPMRQVEVVRDVLLDLFDTVPGLEPRDVIVMCADLDTYAPLFEAVLSDGDAQDTPSEQARAGFPRLPFRIADRSIRRENPLGEAFLAVARLVGGRFTAPEVMDVLGLEPMRERFSLTADDLARIRRFVVDLGMRWGLDAEERARFDQPAVETATFRAGLERLALGVALGSADVVVARARPYDGGDRALVGRFIDAVETLHEVVTKLRENVPVQALGTVLDDVVTALFAPKDPWQAHQVRSLVAPIAEAASRVGIDRTLTPDAFMALVEGALSASGGSGAFLGGGITVCAMVPMRSIPFRVVVLVGLDDGVFPRTTERAGFDLTSKEVLPGDRNVADDDRYLLLEAVLSARERLVITYTGRDLRDAERLPPAVPVAELLDTLGRGFLAPGATAESPLDARREAVRAHVLREHPLHGSDPVLFAEDAPFSFDLRRLASARAMRGERKGEAPFVTTLLPAREETTVELDALARFFVDPVRGFFQQRLSVRLEDEVEALDDRERLELDALESWELGQDYLRAALADEERSFEELEARSKLPMGKSGRAALEQLESRLAVVVERARGLMRGEPSDPVAVSVSLDNGELRGRVLDRFGAGRVVASFGRPTPRALVDAWIRHLAAHATPGVAPFETHIVGRGERDGAAHKVLAPVKAETARVLLGRLLRLYREGLRAPLPFFPKSSHAYVKRRLESGTKDALLQQVESEEARREAAKEFEPGFMREGEGESVYMTRLVGPRPKLDVVDEPPFVGSFDSLARELFEPLLSVLREETA